MYEDFQRHSLDHRHYFWAGRLPSSLRLGPEAFETLWNLHPTDYHQIQMHGRMARTPRWQQAYGRDYRYTGRTNPALPILS